MANVPDGEWEVYCSRDQFECFKQREDFRALLTLGRIANALRFYQLAYPLEDKDAPSQRRQRLNSFMFMASVLYEGLQYADVLGKYFSEHSVFRDTFAELMTDGKVRELREGILRHLRNQVSSHFDEGAIGEALDGLEVPNLRFATGRGRKAGATYFDMSDELAVHSILVVDGEKILPFSELEKLMRRTVEISNRFLTCTDRLITAVLMEMGWEARERRAEDQVD